MHVVCVDICMNMDVKRAALVYTVFYDYLMKHQSDVGNYVHIVY